MYKNSVWSEVATDLYTWCRFVFDASLLDTLFRHFVPPDFYTWCHFVFDASLLDKIFGQKFVATDLYTWCHFVFDASLFDSIFGDAPRHPSQTPPRLNGHL